MKYLSPFLWLGYAVGLIVGGIFKGFELGLRLTGNLDV